ncbi:MAG TPA: hypothetical protein VGV64_07710 [Thermoplasmata archaeon]|nr:hypothetical protein [Thermoplasmata archaeon]
MTPDPPTRPRPPEAAPEPCLVPGCGAPSERHLALAEARRAFPELPERGRRAPLCRPHYKEWKKRTKASRALERLGR